MLRIYTAVYQGFRTGSFSDLAARTFESHCCSKITRVDEDQFGVPTLQSVREVPQESVIFYEEIELRGSRNRRYR